MSRGALTLAFVALTFALSADSALGAASPEPRPSPIVIVVDTSGSMNESDGSSSGRIKIDGAKVALLDFLEQVEPETPIGLRNYPAEGEESGDEEGCSTGKEQFEILSRDPTTMAATIRTLHADGDTPTAAALTAAADDLSGTGASQGTIVLVSDGESNCGRDPCDAAREIGESGVDLQTITVGFRVSGAGAKELQCIADQTGGKYLSVSDNEGLAEAFDEISQPRIDLKVDYPPVVTAQVGNDPSGLVRIEASVTNSGQRLARGAVARIRFDVAAGAPAVVRPVVYLGNLAPGASREVSWTFRPSVPPGPRMTLPFAVIAGAQNSQADAEFKAGIQVRDAYFSADEAGAILGAKERLVILGDSYSAGEGADTYLQGTDTDANPCHRSRFTYLARAFDLPDENIIACSGAVTNDIAFAQPERTVDSQLEQLERLRDAGDIDTVVLTMGGNDVGFGVIAKSCLFGFAECSRKVIKDIPLPQQESESSQDYVDSRIRKLLGSLERAYEDINSVVNGPRARALLGAPVPILVLAYPLPTPLTPRDCPDMYDLLSAGEIDFIDELELKLNGTVEKAVAAARKTGAPVFYVPNTEMAFQPDHTVCDLGPYARNLISFNGAGHEPPVVEGSDSGFWNRLKRLDPARVLREKLDRAKRGVHRFERGAQELLHPNHSGYEALTRAVLRWSNSPDAMAAFRALASAPVAPSPAVTIVSSGEDLGQLVPGPAVTLQGGTSYPLTAPGFAPGAEVTIGVHSDYRLLGSATADSGGEVATQIGIPADLEGGDHTLTVSGTGSDGSPHVVEIPFVIAGGGLPLLVTAMLWAAAAGAVVFVLLLALYFVVRRRDRGLGLDGTGQ
jgi:lysophospholipase L1-like esterase